MSFSYCRLDPDYLAVNSISLHVETHSGVLVLHSKEFSKFWCFCTQWPQSISAQIQDLGAWQVPLGHTLSKAIPGCPAERQEWPVGAMLPWTNPPWKHSSWQRSLDVDPSSLMFAWLDCSVLSTLTSALVCGWAEVSTGSTTIISRTFCCKVESIFWMEMAVYWIGKTTFWRKWGNSSRVWCGRDKN